MTKTKSIRSKQLKFILIFVFVGVMLSFAFERGTQIWLNKQLPELLNRNPDRKYNISFDHSKFLFFRKQIVVDGIVFNPVDSVRTGKSKATVLQFRIENPDLKKLFLSQEIVTKKLVVVAPRISIFASGKNTTEGEKEINDFWRNVFTRLSISVFEIENASLDVFGNGHEEPVFSFNSLDLKVTAFEVDTSTIKNPFPVHFANLLAECRGISVKVDTVSNLMVEYLKLTNSQAYIQNIEIIPLLSAEQFIDVKRAKNDWLKISIDEVNLNNFKWKAGNEGASFSASSLHVDSTSLHALTDQRYPKMNKGYKPLLAEMLRRLPFVFSLDSFLITNSMVNFETQAKNQSKTSLMFFNNLYTSGYNLHNTSDFGKRTEFDIIARFMDEASIEASFKMNVNDKQNRFHVTGKMDDMSIETLNDILQPLVGVETVGQIYGIDFNFYGDNDHARGTLDFEYGGLKVKVLRQDSREKNFFLSALSNIALRKSNVITDKRFRQGIVDLDRYWVFCGMQLKME